MNEEEKSKRIWADLKSGKFEVYSPEGDHPHRVRNIEIECVDCGEKHTVRDVLKAIVDRMQYRCLPEIGNETKWKVVVKKDSVQLIQGKKFTKRRDYEARYDNDMWKNSLLNYLANPSFRGLADLMNTHAVSMSSGTLEERTSEMYFFMMRLAYATSEGFIWELEESD